MTRRRTVYALAACLLPLAVSPAAAGKYLGAGVGNVDLDTPGFETTHGYEIFGGYHVARWLALELNYLDIQEAGDNLPPEWVLKGKTLAGGLTGRLPVSSRLEVNGGLGVHQWDFTLREQGTGTLNTTSGTDLYYSIGTAYQISGSMGVGGRFRIYEMGSASVSVLSINLRYAF